MATIVAEEDVRETYPSVSLLVLNFNGETRLKRCIDSLLVTDYPNFQIVVVDNGSIDGSVGFVERHYPNIKVMKNNRNHGYAQAYNRAIDATDSEYIALINNDVIVEPHWLKGLLSEMENNKNVAAVTPKMMFFDGRLINAAGGNCDIYGVGWNRGNGEIDMGQYDNVEEVFYGNGAALLFKKETWREIGSFDERYFMYGEDLDWCWRARLRGYAILYVPHSRVYHQWRGSRATSMVYMLERHWLSTILKNLSLKTLVCMMPKYFILKTLKTIWLFRNGKSNEKISVLKAILWNIIDFRDTWQKRDQIQASRELSDTEIKKYMFKQSFELSLWLKKLCHPFLSTRVEH